MLLLPDVRGRKFSRENIAGSRPLRVKVLSEADDEYENQKIPINRELVSFTEDDQELINHPSLALPVPIQSKRVILTKNIITSFERKTNEHDNDLLDGRTIMRRGGKINLMTSSTDSSTTTKVAVLCHVGNIVVFRDIVKKYPCFWDNNNVDTFISCSSQEIYDHVTLIVNKPSHVLITGNHGCDIGGFLSLLKHIKHGSLDEGYDLYIMIHTKSDTHWRNGMLTPLHNFLIDIRRQERSGNAWVKTHKPLMFSGCKYVRKNYKLVNRNFVKEIIRRNYPDVLDKVDLLTDQYHCREFFPSSSSKEGLMPSIFHGLYPNNKFYQFYEQDVKCVTHWENHGRYEFHRVSNYHYIRSFSKKNSNFVAGTCFAFNKAYMKVLRAIKYDIEFSKLENMYVKNNVPRRIHAWEYAFGLLVYLYDGEIISVEDSCPILSWVSLSKRSAIRRPLTEARIAFMMIPPLEPAVCGGYKTLLRYIKYINDVGLTVDIYMGIAWNDDDVHYNVHSTNYFGEPTCENWFHKPFSHYLKILNDYGIIDHCRNNIYIGLRLQRTYDVVVANAWQTGKAAFLNKDRAKRLAYIIQDREELFYPGDKVMQGRVTETLKPQFKYFCLSRYLTRHFTSLGMPSVKGTVLTYDSRIYKDQNIKRQDEVIVAYYKHKVGRLPWLMERIIGELVSNEIHVHVFPETPPFTSPFIHEHGIQTEKQLNHLYNTCKVGIILSNTNPSRIGFEMRGAGLNVIEYDSVYTQDDCPFLLMKNTTDIATTVKRIFADEASKDLGEFRKKYESSVEKKDLQNFMLGLLL